MSIVAAKVAISGIKTLAIHHFGPDALPLEKQEKTGVAGHDPIEWTRSVLLTKKRELFLPPTYFFGSIKEGGRHVKKGRGSIMYDIAATLQIEDDMIKLCRDGEPIVLPEEPDVFDAYSVPSDELPSSYVERIGVKNPSTKARNIRYRVAVKPGWEMTFTILWDVTIVARTQMQQALNAAGQLVGIADGRGSIGYGRYVIQSFDIQD
ncbi:hypothetical protein H6G45_09195 [Synechocystis sp. FACHB-383]|uniref:hypothetical protein n=1 Tax=Synechocystis sp. FACHB-383 TaxID=2692864 RepID=UPI0016830ECF|nr:hypothetical protein [Synechocystis sp. FACHB-383]MBD2653661.1 hypothetical protein [Synechocystis sp. FACHB-383]